MKGAVLLARATLAGASSADVTLPKVAVVVRTKAVSVSLHAGSFQEAFRAARMKKLETHRFTRSPARVNKPRGHQLRNPLE